MAKLTFKAVRDPEACCWCGKRFKKGDPIEFLGVTSRFDLEPKGEFVEVKLLSEERIAGLIAEEGWKSKKQGSDLIFLTCSRKCFHALRVALAQSGEIL